MRTTEVGRTKVAGGRHDWCRPAQPRDTQTSWSKFSRHRRAIASGAYSLRPGGVATFRGIGGKMRHGRFHSPLTSTSRFVSLNHTSSASALCHINKRPQSRSILVEGDIYRQLASSSARRQLGIPRLQPCSTTQPTSPTQARSWKSTTWPPPVACLPAPAPPKHPHTTTQPLQQRRPKLLPAALTAPGGPFVSQEPSQHQRLPRLARRVGGPLRRQEFNPVPSQTSNENTTTRPVVRLPRGAEAGIESMA